MTRHTKQLGRQPILAHRVRSIGKGGFSFFPNRFLQDGFFASLTADEQRLYLLLVLVGDRYGVSFYHYESLCALLHLPMERYLLARDTLIAKDMLAFDGTRFQVLELPSVPPASPRALVTREDLEQSDPATVRAILSRSLCDAS